MKKLFSIYLISFLIFPTVVYANDWTFKLQKDGRNWVCFDEPSAQKLLQLRIDLPKLKLKITKLNDLMSIQGQQIEGLQNLNRISEEKNIVLLDLNKDLQERIEDGDAWWKSPWLWAGIGAVLGTCATIGIVWAVKGDL
jgi:hypothetical protein